MSDDKDDSSSEMPSNSEFDRRLGALEKWRDVIDLERGQIMGELGEIKGLMQGLGQDVGRRLTSIEDKLEERPSRTEFKEAERQIQSIRAKTGKIGVLSELEVTGPGNMKFKLLGVSGVTIVLVFFLIVVIVALWLVHK
jgi:hypothetical protein